MRAILTIIQVLLLNTSYLIGQELDSLKIQENNISNDFYSETLRYFYEITPSNSSKTFGLSLEDAIKQLNLNRSQRDSLANLLSKEETKNLDNINGSIQNEDTLRQDEMGIRTYSNMTLAFDNDLVTLSLVNLNLYTNWKEGLKTFKSQYKDKNIFIAVSPDNNSQRSEFTMEFFKQHLASNGDCELAYQKTLEKIKSKYQSLEFKHYFHEKIK